MGQYALGHSVNEIMRLERQGDYFYDLTRDLLIRAGIRQGQRLEVLWEREIDPEIITGEAWEAIAKRGFDPATDLRRLPEHAPMELRHGHRPPAVPVALPGRHPARRLPA